MESGREMKKGVQAGLETDLNRRIGGRTGEGRVH